MKRLLLLLVLCFALNQAFAQQRTTPYDFPVKPGTEAWKELKTGQAMADACAIPATVLKELTTEALAKTCLNYPLLNEIFFAGNIQKGMEAVIANFNGLTGLLARKDAATTLAGIYAKMNVTGAVGLLTEEEQGAFTFGFTYVELLLAQPAMVKQLDSRQKTALAKDALAKYNSKNEQQKIFGAFGLTTSAYLMAHIMQAENKLSAATSKTGNEEMNTFLTTAMYSNAATVTVIAEAVKAW